MSFTARPASRSVLGGAAGGNDFNAGLRQNLGERNQAGLVRNGKQRALNFCHSPTKSPRAAVAVNRQIIGFCRSAAVLNHVRRRWRVRAGRGRRRNHAAPAPACVRACVSEVSASSTSSCVPVPASARALASRKASSASSCTVCLRIQNFLRLDEIGIGRAHLQFDLARLVVQVGFGFLVKRLGLDDLAVRQHAVKNVPAQLRAGVPAVDVVVEVNRRC